VIATGQGTIDVRIVTNSEIETMLKCCCATVALRVALCAVLALVLLPCSTAQAASFTLERVRGYAFPDQLVAAPAGPEVAWTVNDHGRRNIWVARGPEWHARQLTAYTEDDGQEISGVVLYGEPLAVMYVRGGDRQSGWDANVPVDPTSRPMGSKVEIWTVPFAGGTSRLVAEGSSVTVAPDGRRIAFLKDETLRVAPLTGSQEGSRSLAIRGKISSPVWSPDGSRVAFVSSRESHSLIGIYTDDHSPILWIAPSPSRDGFPRWSPDSKRIVFIRRPGPGGPPPPALSFEPIPWSLWVADVTTGEAKLRWSSGKSLRDSFPGLGDSLRGYLEWAAGGRLVFLSYRDGWQHLYSLPESGGEPLLLTPGDFMVEDVALSPDRRCLVFSANTGADPDDSDRRHLYRAPVDRAQARALTSGTGLEWSPVAVGNDRLVFIESTAQRPPQLATLPLEGGAALELTGQALAKDFPTQELVTPGRVTFAAKDGVVVHGQLFEPREATGKHPAVLYIHGGPSRQMLLGWHGVDYYSNDYAVNQYLANQGYVVLAVNYRLGVGYGHDLQYPAGAGARGASEYQDIQAAGAYLQALRNVDPRRVGLYGGSYGGYLAAMALAHDSDVFAVGVDIHGVHNWTGGYTPDEPYVPKRYERPADADRAADVAWKSSPISAVSSWRSPVLFIHGDDDRNVRFNQTVDLVRRLQDTDVHLETLVLVDDTHHSLRYANEIRMDKATVDFLQRYLSRGQ
jgi:dipeptidyl aminopeptidase/acylaminoacyl peptidase